MVDRSGTILRYPSPASNSQGFAAGVFINSVRSSPSRSPARRQSVDRHPGVEVVVQPHDVSRTHPAGSGRSGAKSRTCPRPRRGGGTRGRSSSRVNPSWALTRGSGKLASLAKQTASRRRGGPTRRLGIAKRPPRPSGRGRSQTRLSLSTLGLIRFRAVDDVGEPQFAMRLESPRPSALVEASGLHRPNVVSLSRRRRPRPGRHLHRRSTLK